MFAGAGISKSDDPFTAGKEAVEMAVKEMRRKGGKNPTFGLVFCSGGKYGKSDKTIRKLVDGAHSIFGNTPWVGCTTVGEISNYGATTDSCVAMTIGSEYIKVGVSSVKYDRKNPEKVGSELVKTAMENLKIDKYVDAYLSYIRIKKVSPAEFVKMIPYVFLILGKGPEVTELPFLPNIYENEFVLRGAQRALGTGVKIIGGAAAGGWECKKNYCFANGECYSDRMVGVAMFINLFNSIGLAHAYEPTGKIATVTDVKDYHWIRKLNGKPAVDVYSELSGIDKEVIKKDPFFASMKSPFAVKDLMGEYWLKVVGKYFMGGLYTGSIIEKNIPLCLMKLSKDGIINAALNAAKVGVERMNDKPAFALVFDCGIRKKMLGEKVSKEINTIKSIIGKDTPFLGFYTFGEFGNPPGSKTLFHNNTIEVFEVFDKLMA